MTIPVTGWAQVRLGGKRLWMLALGVFLVASILCSLAWDAPSLITFRVLQGVGAGAMLPLMSTLVVQAAHGKDLGRVISTLSLPAVLGPILGPVLGGAILTFLDWRWLFWVNVPFCVVSLILAGLLLPTDGPGDRVRLDAIGLALLSPSIVGILYGLSNVTRAGGFTRADVLVLAIGGVLLLVGFILRALRRPEHALVDLRLLAHRPLAASSGLLFLSGVALYGAMLLLPLYWQQVRGADALGRRVLLIPRAERHSPASRWSPGPTSQETASAHSWSGDVAHDRGLATVPFTLASTSTNEWLLMAALLARGMGLGAVTIPLMAGAFVGLARHEVPHASIITRIATQIGGSFGVAVLAVILQAAAVTAQTPADVAAAFDRAFWWAVGFAALGAVLSFLLPARPKPAAGSATQTPPEGQGRASGQSFALSWRSNASSVR